MYIFKLYFCINSTNKASVYKIAIFCCLISTGLWQHCIKLIIVILLHACEHITSSGVLAARGETCPLVPLLGGANLCKVKVLQIVISIFYLFFLIVTFRAQVFNGHQLGQPFVQKCVKKKERKRHL